MSRLAKRLEDDLDWRRAELAELKLLIGSSAATADRDRALLRSILALLYAHFEGFLRFALESYADELTSQQVRSYRLKPDLVPAALMPALGAINKVSKLEFLTGLAKAYKSAARFSIDFGEGNFWPDKVERFLEGAALHSSYLDRERLRLQVLVSRRNDIAHGKPLQVRSLAEYQEYEDGAMTVMYDVAIAIDEALNGKTYLRG